MSTEIEKNEVGRPTVMTKDVLQKLEAGFAYAYSDREACLYAGISPATLYEYQKAHPEFLERKQALRLSPNLKAKKTLVDSLDKVPTASWWLERKSDEKDEFVTKTKVEHGGNLALGVSPVIDSKAEQVKNEYEEKLRQAIEAPLPQPTNDPKQEGPANPETAPAQPATVAASDSQEAGVHGQ